MKGYIKLAMYKDDTYGLISEFINDKDEILFAYTKEFNNKFIYMLVEKEINNKLIKKYLSND
jgi:hypothetical protein